MNSFANKFTYGVLSAIFLLVGCTQDTIRPNIYDQGLQATITEDLAATRSIVIDNPGANMESLWVGGDKIGVTGNGASNLLFTLTDEQISEEGKKARFVSTADTPSGELLAYYPYQSDASASGNTLKLSFPAQQEYVTLEGVGAPDPAACIMMGSGSKELGLEFRNVMSVIKIGQIFDRDVVVSSLTFRDLSGKPSSGRFELEWNSGKPQAKFTESQGNISLNIDGGLEVSNGSVQLFYLVVPAREYPKGFELSFELSDGEKIAKSVGTKMGKTLERSVVYTIGDAPSPGKLDQMADLSYTLKSATIVMTPDNLDMIDIQSKSIAPVRDVDGAQLVDADNVPIYMPQLSVTVHKDLNPREGGWMLFNQPTSDLPHGGVFKIAECRKLADGEHYDLALTYESNFAAPFQELSIGELILDEQGEISDAGAVMLDLGSYLRSMKLVSDETTVIPTMIEVGKTKASRPFSKSFTSPKLNLSVEQGDCKVGMGVSVSMSVKMLVRIMDGELQYSYLKIEPGANFSADFAISQKIEIESRKNLYTLQFMGIPVGPIVLVPEIGFSAVGAIGGELTLSTSLNFQHDYGFISMSYNRGDGFTCRNNLTLPTMQQFSQPQLGAEISGKFYAKAALGVRAGLSIYGLFSMGADIDLGAEAAVGYKTDNNGKSEGPVFSVGPTMELKPYVAALGGYYNKTLKGFQMSMDMDPWYERYLIPNMTHCAMTPIGQNQNVIFKELDNAVVPVSTGYTAVDYEITIEKPMFENYELVIDVWRGSGIEYQFNGDQTPDQEAQFNKYYAAGLAYAYRGGGISTRLVNPFLLARRRIGTYFKEQETMSFSGRENYAFQSGIPYALGVSLVHGDQIIPLKGIVTTDSGPNWAWYAGRNAFEYYWPGRPDGVPYVLK